MGFALMKNQKPAMMSAAVATGSALPADNATMPSLLPGEEIYDALPGLELPYPWLEFIGYTIAVIAAFYLLRALYLWITAPVMRERVIILQSPQKMALRAIERLKLSPVWQQKQLKEISETIAHILKDFALEEHQIGLGAPATTDELLQSLQSSRVKAEVYTDIKDLMSDCDRIKYTGSEILPRSPEEMLNILKELILTPGWLK